MTLTKSAQRTLIAVFCAVLLAVYMVAWMTPSIGALHDDADYLITAKQVLGGERHALDHFMVPLFPGVLALFTLASQQTQWLKSLPLLCTLGWLMLTYRLLLKMGASSNGALTMVALTAAFPTVVSLGTNLLPESLFALLATAALLNLLNDRALAAGICAGLASLTMAVGVPLIFACTITLTVRGRFRRAILFTAVSTIVAAPWFGWSLASASHSGAPPPSHILAGLRASEKLVVLGRNFVLLTESPFTLMSGTRTLYAGIGTVVLIGWSLFRRRQLVPDLFVALYCLVLLFEVRPPDLFIVPILPLVLWILWRAFHNTRRQEAFASVVLILTILPLSIDLTRLPTTWRLGQFPMSNQAPNDWNQMRKLFTYIRGNTNPDTVILANLDTVFYLDTGRRSIRGFTPDNYRMFYAPPGSIVRPDEISTAIMMNGVSFVVLTPDRDFTESPSFHASVEALERGGLLEPVSVPGLPPDYRLLQTASFKFRQ